MHNLGFQKVSIVKPDLKNASHKLKIWLDQKYHGSMDWMEKHGEKRYVPEKLVVEENCQGNITKNELSIR